MKVCRRASPRRRAHQYTEILVVRTEICQSSAIETELTTMKSLIDIAIREFVMSVLCCQIYLTALCEFLAAQSRQSTTFLPLVVSVEWLVLNDSWDTDFVLTVSSAISKSIEIFAVTLGVLFTTVDVQEFALKLM